MTTKHQASSSRQSPSRIFWGISSFEALAMFRRGLFYNYLSIYLRYFLNLSVTETTFFATFPMILNIVFQTAVWGPLSDKYQRRRTLIICGEFLAGFGTLLVWYAHIMPDSRRLAGYVIITGLSCVEAFWSMSNIGKSALLSDIYRHEERSAVQGRLSSIGGVGRIIGVWIGGLLYDGLSRYYDGWGFHEGALFFVASGVMFFSILPMLLVPEGGVQHQENAAPKPSSQQSKTSTSSGKLFFVFLVAMTFIHFGRNSIAVILAQYLVLESGLAVSSKILSYIMNAESVAMIVTGIMVGWLVKRIGNGKALLFGTFIAISALCFLAIAGNLPLVYLSSFLRGCSDVIIMASSYTFASVLIPPEKRARHFGLFNATFFLSFGLAGTFIAGPLIDLLIAFGKTQVFAYRMSFVVAALMTAIGFLIQGSIVYVLLPRTALGGKHNNGL